MQIGVHGIGLATAQLRPIGTEFDCIVFPDQGSTVTKYALHRMRVVAHSDLEDGGKSERLETIEITTYPVLCSVIWCGRIVPVPHRDLLPYLDAGFTAMLDHYKL